MQIHFLLHILLFLTIPTHILSQPPDPSPSIDYLGQVYNSSLKLFQKLLLNSTQSLHGSISSTCINAFTSAYNGTNWLLYMHKFVTDSSKNKADLGSYRDCHETNYDVYNISTSLIHDNLTYVILNIEVDTNISVASANYSEGEYIIGVCVTSGCTIDEYKRIFIYINNIFEMFGNLTYNSSIRTFDMKTDKRKDISWFAFVPPSIILLFASFSLFPIIPSYILYPIFKNKATNSRNRIKNCFRLFYNSKEILSAGNTKDRHLSINDTGINIYQGIRSITYIIFILGVVFVQIFISPNRVFLKKNFSTKLNSVAFIPVLYGIRFAPQIFYAISGVILVFKLLHYLDNQIDIIAEEEERKGMLNKETSDLFQFRQSDVLSDGNVNVNMNIINNAPSELSGSLINNTYKQSVTDDPFVLRGEQPSPDLDMLLKEQEDQQQKLKYKQQQQQYTTNNNNNAVKHPLSLLTNKQNNISCLNPDNYMEHYIHLKHKFLFTFILRTLYKYIMFIFALVYFKWTLIATNLKLEYPANPMWFYFREYYADHYKLLNHFLSHIFFYYGYTNTVYFQFDPFIIVGNELAFFIITTIIIFTCYKKNYALGTVLIIVILLLEVIKLITYLTLSFNDTEYYPVVPYHENNYTFIINSTLYNYPSFLIGVIIGLVNYCIQDSSKAGKEKKFVLLPRSILKSLAKHKAQRVIYAIATLVVFVVCVIWQKVVIGVIGDIEKFNRNTWVNVIALFDSDVGVFCLLMFVVQMFLSGDNIIINSLNSRIWKIFSRPYYTNILITQCIAFYVFHMSENIVKIEIVNIFFFSFVILVVVLLVGLFIFVFVEMPLKRLNKLMFLKVDNTKINSRDNVSIL